MSYWADFLKENDAVVGCINDDVLLSDKPSNDVAFDSSAAGNPKFYV